MIFEQRHLKARAAAIHQLLKELPAEERKNNRFMAKNTPRELLKQGYIHPTLATEFAAHLKTLSVSLATADAVPFATLCQFNNWFALHPEKVCGTEAITTSKEFPIAIIGDKTTVTQTIEQTLKASEQPLQTEAQQPHQNWTLANLEAQALLLKLQILNAGQEIQHS